MSRIALVTGAGSAEGIGFAIARHLAEQGMTVALTSTTDRCRERAAQLVADGHRAVAFAADLTDRAQVVRLHASVLDAVGVPLVLVNNAGMTSVVDPMPESRRTDLVDPADWLRLLERNVLPAHLVTHALLPDMVAARHGRIVTIASTTGVTGAMVGESAYATAKAGLVGFTRALAVEYARDGITANAVAPGWIATASQTDDERRQGLATPAGRSGTPDEIAHMVAALCADAAGYITGQCIVIDGGNAVAEERA